MLNFILVEKKIIITLKELTIFESGGKICFENRIRFDMVVASPIPAVSGM
jgi:hypothetical protein